MPRPQVKIILHNIRSTYNVGAILRTAEGLGVEEVIYSGYTPRYHDERLLPHLREKLDHQIAKAALGAEKLVQQRGIETIYQGPAAKSGQDLLTNFVKCATMEGWGLVGLENNLSAAEKPRRRILGESRLADELGEKIMLFLGEEVQGIPAEIREKLEVFLEIPMLGTKESFNVSVATGITLWALKNRARLGTPLHS